MKYDFFKMMHGKTIEDVGREVPSAENTVDRIVAGLKSKYNLRLLGKAVGTGDEKFISEEERYVNFHILGAPGEGKSKFLEYHIRRDIDMGNGLCLIDPSDKGDTARNVLNYCAKINHKNVILIDPTTIQKYKKIPLIAPLSSKSVKRSVAGMMDSLSILFDAKSTTTPRIRTYLTALFRIIARENKTLDYLRYFTNYNDGKNMSERLGFDPDSKTIKDLFRTPYSFEQYFSSSRNRLEVFWQEPLLSILSNTEGINFKRAVGDGWVILVNLSPYELTEDEAQLLGIIVISQIIQAVDSLVNNDWHGVFYLYIDEAGSFVTPQLATVLQKKRKSGIRVYLAHHNFAQFKGKEELATAVENETGVKLMFNTRSYDDRMRMIKSLGYGGNIPPTLAAYANQDLPKQHAVLKKNKETPVRIRIPDVEPVPEAPREYIEEILSQSFYKDVRSIREDIKSPEPRKVDDPETIVPPPVSRPVSRKLEKSIRPDNKKPPEPPPKRPIKI